MKKGKPSRWTKHYWFVLLGLIIGFALWRVLPFQEMIPPSNYQCPEEIPQFAGETVNRDLLVETLGFEHPQLLEGINYDPVIHWEWLTMTCSVVNNQAYIALVYPTGSWGWRMQMLHFEGNRVILQVKDALKGGDYVSYIGQEDSTGAIIADQNHNGLPEAIVFFQVGCNCVNGDLWVVEFTPEGTLKDISPSDSSGFVYTALDWNRDGVLDLVGETSYRHIAFPKHINHIFSWNGSAYSLVYLRIDGVDNENFWNYDEDICQVIADSIIINPYPTSAVASRIHAGIYFYDKFLNERERAWELINPILDQAAACPYNPALPIFFAEMAEIHQQFEGD